MILGYIDKEDRAYDLNFATLRMRIRIEAVSGETRIGFLQVGAAGARTYRVLGQAEVRAAASMDHGGHLVPLLRPVPGRLHRHERGFLFVAQPPKRAPEDPTFFLVKLRAMPEAVRFFFEDQEGTEILSVPDDEVIGVERVDDAVRVRVTAANLALPKETLAYAIDFSPRRQAMPLLDGLPVSARR